MPQCSCCNAETDLFDSGVPICIDCCERQETRKPPVKAEQVRRVLYEDVQTATLRAKQALVEFNTVMRDVPSGIPHSDGTQRVRNVARELSMARMNVMKAHTRLNDFLTQGVIPEDIRRAGGVAVPSSSRNP